MSLKWIRRTALGLTIGLTLWSRMAGAQDKKEPPKTDPPKGGAATDPKTTPGQGTKPVTPAPPTVADLDRRAEALIEQGKGTEAIPLLKQAIGLDPKSIQTRVLLGRAYITLRQFPNASQSFQAAVDLSPKEPEFLYYLGLAQSNETKFTVARSSFDRALELSPSDVRYRIAVADSYLQEKAYLPARRSLLEALGFAPDSPDVHARLGDLNEQENRHVEALDEYDAALRIDSKSVGALLGRASALSGLKRFPEAEKIVRDMIAANAKSPDAHSTLAQILDAEGKHLSAIAEYRLALEAAPDSASLWGNLGWSQYEEGLMDESVTSGRKALALDPKQAYVRFNIGLAYAARDQWTQALKEYQEGIAIAAVPDIHAATNDLRDVITKGHSTSAVQRAIELLKRAELKASGLPEDILSLPGSTGKN
ncbi:MAG: Tetratricopeptide 2 repeat-containing protein [Chthonomonadales bacterium]|nr:Tetratricopeptide 2 repeat-containing protein [Chthonomonadales bacterium]